MRGLDLLIEQVMAVLGDEELFRIRRLEHDIVEKREIEMLSNIYVHSKNDPYNSALFFIGSGHRESILKKIAEFDATQETKLNWIVRDNENYLPVNQVIAS